MQSGERRVLYTALLAFALAFGWIEATVVVYLREVYLREVALHGPSVFAALQVTLVSLPRGLVVTEMAREMCTIALLAAVAWLAGGRPAARAGAFLLAFGVWDVTYYAALQLMTSWPGSLSAWDILFLVPLPWVAPVWAPITVATLFIIAGSYLFWTPERPRVYGWTDAGVLTASALVTIAAFLVESSAVINHRPPERFPLWVFWAGVVLGAGWFTFVERRAVPAAPRRTWTGERVGTLVNTPSEPARESKSQPPPGAAVGDLDAGDVHRVIEQYAEARRRRERVLEEADRLAVKFDHLAHGLSDDIRESTEQVEQLRERLVLMGRADVVENPDVYFH